MAKEMACDVQVKLEVPNSCCAQWKSKFSKLEEKRNALRQAVKLLEQQIDKIQAEAKKVRDEERARFESEKEGKEKESAARLALENEVASLKAEIVCLKQKGGKNVQDGNSEVKILQARVAEGEKEIKRLKEAVQIEKKRADLERRIADGEKKKAAEESKGVQAVKVEKEITENYGLQMEGLKKEVDELRSKLASGMVKLNEANRKLEAEKKKVVKETKRAEIEKARAEEQRKLAEACKKQAVEGRFHAHSLSRELEESKKRIDEAHGSELVQELSLKLDDANKKLLVEKQKASTEKERADGAMLNAESHRKTAEANWKRAMEEKSRADKLCRRLEEDKLRITELEKQVKELSSSKAVVSIASKELKLLKKQLKLEKMKRNHSKDVVELERSRNNILQHEVARLKLDFDQFLCRLDLIHKSFSPGSGATAGLEKNLNVASMSRLALNPSFAVMDTSGTLTQNIHHTAHLGPLPGGNFIEPIPGINSKLESLLGGSTRTMLKSPAVNSSTTSFSNGQLVAQDKGAFSVATSAKSKLVDECAQPAVSELSDEVAEMRSSENLTVVAENSVRGPVSNAGLGKVTVHGKKRKRILDTVETIENLYIEDKKLHLQIEEKLTLLHGIVDKQLDKGFGEGKFLPPSLLDASGSKLNKHSKRKKVAFQQRMVTQHGCATSEQKKDEIEVHGGTKLGNEASPIGVDLVTEEAKKEGTEDATPVAGFEELANGDFMSLLNLDDAAFEECYRAAMEMPLSPTLPEIDIACVETEDVALCEQSNSDAQKSVDTLGILEDNWHTSCGERASVCLNHSGMDMEMANEIVSVDEQSRLRFEGELGDSSSKILEHCIVFSNLTDRNSNYRIFLATRNFKAQLSLATQTGWMVREILLAVKMEEKLLAKEKVYALFSLLMINFSVAASSKFGDCLNWASIPCLDSFAEHVHSVMTDVEMTSFLAQQGCLDELLSLFENFLVDQEFKVLRYVSFGVSVERDSRDNIQVDDSKISLSFEPASAEQLIEGSVILASITAALDHIGFICETSYNILRANRLGNSLMLTILHIFAYLGGDKFFCMSDYSLMMTVIKPVVRNIEELGLSGGSICCNPLVNMKCPFVDNDGNSVSMETVTSLLMEKICGVENSEKIHHVVEPVFCADQPNGQTLFSLTDVLALLELVACHKGWEWTSEKIVPQLLKLLESGDFKNSTSGVVILLGQLGRLGIQGSGYEDTRVEQVRSELTAFLRRGISMGAGLSIEIAIVTSLLGLLSVDLEMILQTNEKVPTTATNSESIDLLKKWLSLQNKKQQDLLLNSLQSDAQKT